MNECEKYYKDLVFCESCKYKKGNFENKCKLFYDYKSTPVKCIITYDFCEHINKNNSCPYFKKANFLKIFIRKFIIKNPF